MTRPDLDAIRARCDAAQVIFDRNSVVAPCVYDDIPALLAYVDELERDLNNERAAFESCNRARMHCEYECATLKARTTYTVGETEWAHRIAVAEQRFVDEYDAHQETRTLLTDLWRKQAASDAAQMREYGISYDGVRKLITDYLDDELSLGKVVELLRAAARELARVELSIRDATIEARDATIELIEEDCQFQRRMRAEMQARLDELEERGG